MAPNQIEGPKLDRIYKTFVSVRNILSAFPSSISHNLFLSEVCRLGLRRRKKR